MPNPNFSVTIPENPDELIGLSKRVLAKNTLDGATSPLSPLNMADMNAKTNQANAKNVSAKQLNRDKEEAFELRDIALGIDEGQEAGVAGTVDVYLKSCRDVLLGIYKGKEQALGDWGYEVDKSGGNVSVFIPVKPKEMIDLAILVRKKHLADGAASPLKSLNMGDFSSKINTANTQHTAATQLNRDKETANRDRDTLLGIAAGQKLSTGGTVRFYVTSCRDVLQGVKKGQEQHLGDWGYDVQFNTGSGVFTSISLFIEPGSTKSALKNFVFEPAMQFELSNTGDTQLTVCITTAENLACGGGVILDAGAVQVVTPADLGTGTFMNVTNSDAVNVGKLTVKKL